MGCLNIYLNTFVDLKGLFSLSYEWFQYHIDQNIPLFESVYRIGSKKHLLLIKEARKLYSRGVLDLCEEDEGIMESHLGEFDLYERHC